MLEFTTDIVVLLVSTLLIAPAGFYKARFLEAGRWSAPLGFLLLSIYALLRLEDFFQRVLTFIASVECAIVSLYTAEYSKAKYSKSKSASTVLYTLNNIFGLLIVLFLASKNVVLFSAFFVLAGLVGFFLVAFDSLYNKSQEAWRAAVKYLAASMVPSDVAVLALVGLSLSQNAVLSDLVSLRLEANTPLILVILIGFLAKAAVAPLHFWIADAHSVAPAPASAILSGLMVKMGVYGAYVTLKVFETPHLLLTATAILATMSTIYGGVQALLQDDMKRLLAYSTMSNTSAMVLLLVLGELVSWVPVEAVTVFVIAHSLFKTSLFLDSGFVELAFGSRRVSEVRGVAEFSLKETLATSLSLLSLIGVPPTLGFLYKMLTFSFISESAKYSGAASLVLFTLALKTALSAGYALKYIIPHLGSHLTKEAGASLELDEALEKEVLKNMTRYVLLLSLLNVLAAIPILLLLYLD
ncbi:MAG: complex I subunit 5 family protein [Acidilobaceae archaeon]